MLEKRKIYKLLLLVSNNMVKVQHLSIKKNNPSLGKLILLTSIPITAFYAGIRHIANQPQDIQIQAAAEEVQDNLELRCETVEQGDTLQDVAYNIAGGLPFDYTLTQLIEQNGLKNEDILPGREICVWLDYTNRGQTSFEPAPVQSYSNVISPIFTPEVQYWAKDIARWAQEYNLDPNLVATVMRIESNGDREAVSEGGALGLFQVMPFHFSNGEDSFDPDTNARRGMNFLQECLTLSKGAYAPALACYNGGFNAGEWFLGKITRQDYVTFIDSLWGYGEGEAKAQQVERYVDRGVSVYNQAISNH